MKTTIILLLIFITVFGLLSYISFLLTTHNIRRKSKRSKNRALKVDMLFGKEISEGIKYIKSTPCEEWMIESFDGLILRGRFFKNGDSCRTIILFHGFRSSGEHDFSCAFKMYFEHGYNILIPDQRAHGKSEGRYITYGVLERYDALEWIKKVIRECGKNETVYLSGVSMGASTVLMASGLELPQNVRGIIADCGFTSPEAIIKKVMREDMHIPIFPLFYTVRLIAKAVTGCELRYSTIDALKSCTVPILFIHGTDDDFVPFYMGEENFAACPTQKRCVWVDGAGHGMSFLLEPERCVKEFEAFIDTTH